MSGSTTSGVGEMGWRLLDEWSPSSEMLPQLFRGVRHAELNTYIITKCLLNLVFTLVGLDHAFGVVYPKNAPHEFRDFIVLIRLSRILNN